MADRSDSLLNAYLDGELAPRAQAAFEKRLAQPAVARRLARLRGLRAQVAAVAPHLSAADSQRLWVGIRARLAAQPVAVETQSWFVGLFSRRWAPVWGLGLAGGAALALVLFLRPVPAPVAAFQPALSAEASTLARPQARRGAGVERSGSAAARPDASPLRSVAAAPPKAVSGPSLAAVPAAADDGPSEVQRALDENPVDDLINRALQSPRPMGSLQGGSLAAYGQTHVVEDAPAASAAVGAVRGAVDSNGFWDWRPAAVAMNQHQWGQARAELLAAQAQAGSASERSFAASALSLLAAPGAPLEGSESPVPPTGDLRVLGTGRWQLRVDERLARFSQGVSVRLPGLRCEGNALLLDLTFDRADFAPGARFTRVGGETPVKVVDAADHPVDADQFAAPAGADYNVAEHVLRLR